MASLRALFGFPTSWANKRVSITPVAGPSSYTQVSAAAGTVPITGGQLVNAKQWGLKALDLVITGITDDGCFRVEAIPVTVSTSPNCASVSYRLKWTALVSATIGGQAQTAGSEAVATTNLTQETVRLLGLGPN